MTAGVVIRAEKLSDVEAIEAVTIAAFEDHPISRQTEHFIVRALRAAGALTISLVAEAGGEIVGHIALSPVRISDGTQGWYGLGPISVLPSRQRQGIGSALMREGLAQLKTMCAAGCALVGDPAYYTRFGFRNVPELVHEGVPPEVFLVLPFGSTVPQGTVSFHQAFAATA